MFDERQLQYYFDNKDYDNAINYLQSIPAKDYKSQMELNRRIRDLQALNEKEKSYVYSLDENSKQAYYFLNSINGNADMPLSEYDNEGNLVNGTYNYYGDKYTKLINGIQNINKNSPNYGKHVRSLEFEISDENIEQFAHALGIENIYENNYGIRYITKDSNEYRKNFGKFDIIGHGDIHRNRKTFRINVDNPNIGKILNALNIERANIKQIEKDPKLAGALAGMAGGSGTGAAIGSFFGPADPLTIPLGSLIGGLVGGIGGYFAAPSSEEYSETYPETNKLYYKLKAIDDNGAHMNIKNINFDDLKEAANLIDEANEIMANHPREENKEVLNEITVLPYLGMNQAKLYKDYQAGKLTPNEYKSINDELTKQYNDALRLDNLAQHEVYSNYDSKITKKLYNQQKYKDSKFFSSSNLNLQYPTVSNKLDNKSKTELNNILKIAMEDGRVSYGVGIAADGTYGTYIQIAGKSDSEGNPSMGINEQTITLFVPGLFGESEAEAYKADTETIALQQAAELSNLKYIKELNNGERIFSRDNKYYLIPKTAYDNGSYNLMNPSNFEINKSEAVNRLHEEYLVNSAIDQLVAASIENFNNPSYNNPNLIDGSKLNSDGTFKGLTDNEIAKLIATNIVLNINNNLSKEEQILKRDEFFKIINDKLYSRIRQLNYGY